jgi:hypothetical protein
MKSKQMYLCNFQRQGLSCENSKEISIADGQTNHWHIDKKIIEIDMMHQKR